MQRSPVRNGFSLVETIIALLIFSVGGLALASTAAMIGRQLRVDELRERGGRIAASRLETLRASCRGATSGSQFAGGVRSDWSVVVGDSGRTNLTESVSYVSWSGPRSDTYRAVVQCQ
jgi:prepilin-type N-terminal cleavage/methylation domain-containing protein